MNGAKTGKALRVLKRTARLALADPHDALLTARMALWVVLITVLARLTSLPRAQRLSSSAVRSRSLADSRETPAKLGELIDRVLGIDLFVFRRSCWKRALVLHRYLALNGIESQIKFGLRKESNGMMDGHAWLESKGQPLLEDNAHDYVVTFTLPVEPSAAAQATSASYYQAEPGSLEL